MMPLSCLWRSYRASRQGTAVELALILPLLILFFTASVDLSHLFADRRAAQRLAESIVRAAHTFDEASRPLSDDHIIILRNIAARMAVQLPSAENYIWIGRYVRPQPRGNIAATVQQLLPDGLARSSNQGLVLVGTQSVRQRVNSEILANVEAIAAPGELIYAVEVGFTRAFLTPLPSALQQRIFTVRYLQ
jgi:TadE-like protein